MTEAVIAVMELEVPVSIPAKGEMGSEDFVRYLGLARRLGAVNGAVRREMLLQSFAKYGIVHYPLDKVEVYLDSKFGVPEKSEPGLSWCWAPLRDADLGRNRDIGKIHWMRRPQGNNRNGNINDVRYEKPVPEAVLETVEKILQDVPEAYFFISEHCAPGDPFLGVIAEGTEMLVIERWDEQEFQPWQKKE